MFLKQTSELVVKSSINDCLTKEKGGYLPNKLLIFSSFEKQKVYDLALHQKVDGYKETYNKYK